MIPPRILASLLALACAPACGGTEIWLGVAPASDGGVAPEAGPASVASADAGCGIAPGATTRTLMHAGLTRTYLLVVPDGLDPCVSPRVLLAIHGRSADGDPTTGRRSAIVDAANRARVLAVFPQGLAGAKGEPSWACAGCDPVLEPNDDVGFVRALLADLRADRRVVAIGNGEGGAFVHRLAAELPLTAGVVLGGVLGSAQTGRASDVVRPVAKSGLTMILHHGDDDRQFPIDGGLAAGVYRTPFAEALDFWRVAGGCSKPDSAIETTTTKSVRSGCTGNIEVIAVRWKNTGHTIPDADPENDGASVAAALDLALSK